MYANSCSCSSVRSIWMNQNGSSRGRSPGPSPATPPPTGSTGSGCTAASRAAAAALPSSRARRAAAASRDILAYGMGDGGASSKSAAPRLPVDIEMPIFRLPPKEANMSPRAELDSAVLGGLGCCAASCPSPVRSGGPRGLPPACSGLSGTEGPVLARGLGFLATSAPGADGP
eukprot:scaffold1658_cov115-Isochrysis_galbana.AAC.16